MNYSISQLKKDILDHMIIDAYVPDECLIIRGENKTAAIIHIESEVG
jgi:hypothetical protein